MSLLEILERDPERLQYGAAAENIHKSRTGKSLLALLTLGGRTDGEISPGEVRTALWSLLRRRDKRLTLREVGQLLDDFAGCGGDLRRLVNTIIYMTGGRKCLT